MKGYQLVKCKDCNFVWDSFSPENLLTQYDKTYYINSNPKGGYANYNEGMRINRKTFSDRLKKIEKKHGKGVLLDVGCALGDCLMEAKKLGWKNTLGLEVSEYACKKAIKRSLNIKNGKLSKNTFPAESFDIVLYQDVLEHISDPFRELIKVKRVLKKGGLLFIVTPDIGGWWSKLLGSLWYHYKPVEHVSYFSKRSLKRVLLKAGFNNIEIQGTYHVLSVEYILNRLRYYSPFVFGGFLNIIKKTPIKNMSFKAYTGEIEAWAIK